MCLIEASLDHICRSTLEFYLYMSSCQRLCVLSGYSLCHAGSLTCSGTIAWCRREYRSLSHQAAETWSFGQYPRNVHSTVQNSWCYTSFQNWHRPSQNDRESWPMSFRSRSWKSADDDSSIQHKLQTRQQHPDVAPSLILTPVSTVISTSDQGTRTLDMSRPVSDWMAWKVWQSCTEWTVPFSPLLWIWIQDLYSLWVSCSPRSMAQW